MDPHDVLGISKDADDREVKKAYLKLASVLHPDVNPSPDASEKFVQVQLAYETLTAKVEEPLSPVLSAAHEYRFNAFIHGISPSDRKLLHEQVLRMMEKDRVKKARQEARRTNPRRNIWTAWLGL